MMKSFRAMKLIKILIKYLVIGVGATLLSSCIMSNILNTVSQLYDYDPYSNNRNENRSLVGFYLNGSKFYESYDVVVASPITTVRWNIVTINNEDYIIAIVPTGWAEGSQLNMFAVLYLLMPYHNVVLGEEYSSFLRSAIAIASDEKVFIVDGEVSSYYFTPIDLSVRYTKTKDRIQGSFEATGGIIETTNGDQLSIILTNGLFNLTYSGGYIKGLSYDDWLSSILNNSVFLINEEENAETIAEWNSMTTDN